MRFALLAFSFVLLASSTFAQIVGGEFRTLYHFDSGGSLEYLGFGVASAGDVNADGVNDFMIGASGTTVNGIYAAGSAFVYSGADGSLLHRFDGELPHYGLGYSVAGAGDVNGDGYDDLIVGVPSASPGGLYGAINRAGSVYVYSGLTGAVLHRFDGALPSDSLGTAVDGAGDVNGDGFDDVIIGATWATIGGIVRNGAVYVYSGSNGALLYQYDGPGEYSRMGQTVAGVGDLDQDGHDDFFVGVSGVEVSGMAAAGSAMVYSGATGTLLMQFDGASALKHFGSAVASAGDVNRDGVADLIVGAPENVYVGLRLGSAYVFSGATGALLHTFHGESPNGHLGASVASAGDVDGDSFDDLIIGAPGNSENGVSKSGAAFIYSGATGRLIQKFDHTLFWHALGSSVAGIGDLNGDGHSEVLVGAPDSYNDPFAGEAFVYSLAPFLHVNLHTISIAVGGSLDFDLSFPVAAALKEYRILMSMTGTGPSLYGIAIPLTQDSLLQDTFHGSYPVANHTGMFGTLDASGNAQANMILPPALPSALLGRTFWAAAIAYRAGGLPEFSSIAIPVTFVP